MGQKINPVGLRLQVNRTWESRWFSNTKEYGDLLHEDLEIRKFIKKNCAQSGISRIVIERPHKKCRVSIYACLLYTSPSPRDISGSRMPSSA